MMIGKNSCYILFFMLTSLTFLSLKPYDILLEAKGAAFIPTSTVFRDIYNTAGGMFGLEATFGFNSTEQSNWYGFVSTNVFNKKGKTVCFGSPTEVTLVNVGLGFKYLMPVCYGEFYCGLGVLPTYLKTKDCSPFVVPCLKKWGCGGVAKLGTYVDLPCNFILDFFYDYSFVSIGCAVKCNTPVVQPRRANVSGSALGFGLGYGFN